MSFCSSEIGSDLILFITTGTQDRNLPQTEIAGPMVVSQCNCGNKRRIIQVASWPQLKLAVCCEVPPSAPRPGGCRFPRPALTDLAKYAGGEEAGAVCGLLHWRSGVLECEEGTGTETRPGAEYFPQSVKTLAGLC